MNVKPSELKRMWASGPLRQVNKQHLYVCDRCKEAVDGVYRVANRWLCSECREKAKPKKAKRRKKMKMEYVEKAHKDFKGDHLCDSCWNGRHYVPELKRVRCAYHKAHLAEDDTKCQRCKWKISGKTLLNCKGGKCECMCRELEAEKAAKPKKQRGSDPNQTSFTEMITIGHVDSN